MRCKKCSKKFKKIMKNIIILSLILIGFFSFGQDTEKIKNIKNEFEKLQSDYKTQEKELAIKKIEISKIIKKINGLETSTNQSESGNVLLETKRIYEKLSQLYQKQDLLKKKYMSEEGNKTILDSFTFKKYELPKKGEGLFDSDLFSLLSTNDRLNDLSRNEGFKVNFHTMDIYNPINFTTLIERMPRSNGVSTSYEILNRNGQDYIKKGSQIHIEFDKEFIEKLILNNNLELQVLAFVERKDKTIKPLTVLGFTMVKDDSNQTDKNIKNISLTSEETVEYKYKLNFKESSIKSLSGEVNLAWEEISKDDKIIISVINKKSNGVGFSTTLIIDEFGWQQEPIGGFGFTRIFNSDNKQYNASGTMGYSFRYKPRQSSKFFWHFISPSFGPELNVQQINEQTSIGVGVFLSTFFNTVKLGGGFIANGKSNGKPYFSIGLNFIESYQKISELISKTK